MAKKKLSPRAERRERERAAERLARDMERLSLIEPGGAPERPIPLASASQVEPAARAMACPRCRARRILAAAEPGAVRVEEHAAETFGGVRLRVARVVCVACGGRRAIYFRLGGDALN